MATYTVKSGDGKETLGSFKSMAEAESFMSGEGYSSFSIDDRREGGGRTSGVSIGGGEDALRDIRSGGGDGGIKSIRTNYSGMPFSKAFSSARSTLGPGQTFEWNGKQYSTATAEERPDLAAPKQQVLEPAPSVVQPEILSEFVFPSPIPALPGRYFGEFAGMVEPAVNRAAPAAPSIPGAYSPPPSVEGPNRVSVASMDRAQSAAPSDSPAPPSVSSVGAPTSRPSFSALSLMQQDSVPYAQGTSPALPGRYLGEFAGIEDRSTRATAPTLPTAPAPMMPTGGPGTFAPGALPAAPAPMTTSGPTTRSGPRGPGGIRAARSIYDEIPAELNRLTIQPPEPIFANLPAQADTPPQRSAYQAAVDGALQFLGFGHTPEMIQENLSGAGDRFLAGASGEPFSLSRFAPSKEFMDTFLYGPQPEPVYLPPADINMVGSYDMDAVAAGGAAGLRRSYNMPSPGVELTAAYEPISSAPAAITDAAIKAYREQTGSSLRDDTIRQILEGQQLEDRLIAAQAASEKAPIPPAQSNDPFAGLDQFVPRAGTFGIEPGGLPAYATGTSGLGDYKTYREAYEGVKGLLDYMAEARKDFADHDPVKQREMGQYMFDQAAPYNTRRREDAARGEYAASMAMAPTAPAGGIISLKDVVNSSASDVRPVYTPPQKETFLNERGMLFGTAGRMTRKMQKEVAALEEQREAEALQQLPTISAQGLGASSVGPYPNYLKESLEAARRSMSEVLGTSLAPRRSRIRPQLESRWGM